MQEYIDLYLEYAYSLNIEQLEIIALITFLLLLIMFGRWFGRGGFFVIAILGMLGYGIYKANFYDKYLANQEDIRIHEELVQEEMDK